MSKAGICFEGKWKLEALFREVLKGGWGKVVGEACGGESVLLFGEDGEPLHSRSMEGSHHSPPD